MANGYSGEDALDSVLSFLRRVFASDFRHEKPTRWEMQRMGAAGATPTLAHGYVAWRSSLLYLAGALLLFSAIWNLAAYESAAEAIEQMATGLMGPQTAAQQERIEKMAERNGGVIDAVTLTTGICAVVGACTVAAAAGLWPRVRLSVLLTRVGWALLFVVPFALALLPLASMMDFGDLGGQAAVVIKVLLALLFATNILLTLGPRALALFPGVIRSSMTLKTLLPESRGPGWVTVLLAPLFGVFLWLGLAIANQFPGTGTVLTGGAFLLGGQVVYLVFARRVVQPCTEQQTSWNVLLPRRISAGLSAVGALIVFIWAVTLDGAPVGKIFAFAIGVVGNILLLSVVASDFILPLLRVSHRANKAFVESPLYDSLDTRCAALSFVARQVRARVLSSDREPDEADADPVEARSVAPPPPGGDRLASGEKEGLVEARVVARPADKSAGEAAPEPPVEDDNGGPGDPGGGADGGDTGD